MLDAGADSSNSMVRPPYSRSTPAAGRHCRRLHGHGCHRSGACVDGPQANDDRREVLRQASVALGGRPVTLWEVSAKAELDPRLSSDPSPAHHATHLDVDSTLRRWNISIMEGSRWVGCRLDRDGPWVIAPVRIRPPAPPPGGRERRSGERLTLELAGLCLGLIDGRTGAATAPRARWRAGSGSTPCAWRSRAAPWRGGF